MGRHVPANVHAPGSPVIQEDTVQDSLQSPQASSREALRRARFPHESGCLLGKYLDIILLHFCLGCIHVYISNIPKNDAIKKWKILERSPALPTDRSGQNNLVSAESNEKEKEDASKLGLHGISED